MKGLERIIWEALTFGICWFIWLARNNLHFFGKITSCLQEVLENVLLRVASWIKAKMKGDLFSLDQFRYSMLSVRNLSIKMK